MATGIESKVITVEDLDHLRHMLGINQSYSPSNWGFRNYFAAGPGEQVESMERLVALGWVRKGGQRDDLVYYYATKEGCRAAGLTTQQIKAVFEDS